MVATDEIILQPESIIKKPVVENTRWRKKQLGEVKNGNSSALAEKNNISILGANMIRHVNDIEVSQKSENSKVLLRKFSGFKAGCMKNRFRNAIIQTLGTLFSYFYLIFGIIEYGRPFSLKKVTKYLKIPASLFYLTN